MHSGDLAHTGDGTHSPYVMFENNCIAEFTKFGGRASEVHLRGCMTTSELTEMMSKIDPSTFLQFSGKSWRPWIIQETRDDPNHRYHNIVEMVGHIQKINSKPRTLRLEFVHTDAQIGIPQETRDDETWSFANQVVYTTTGTASDGSRVCVCVCMCVCVCSRPKGAK